MIPKGKGVQVWILNQKDPIAQANAIINAGFQFVALKMANGILDFNQDTNSIAMRSFITVCQAAGVQVVGWQYVYGANTFTGRSIAKIEADAAIRNIQHYGIDGWLIDAETEYKRIGSAAWADTYMTALRLQAPNVSLGLQSFRWPSVHPEFPWSNFLNLVNFHCPQVYWVQASNAGAQLVRSVTELLALKNLPVLPTGSAYFENNWGPTPAQLNDFDQAAHRLGLPGVLWYAWDDHGISEHPDWLAAIKAHSWSSTPPTPMLTIEQKVDILWQERSVKAANG